MVALMVGNTRWRIGTYLVPIINTDSLNMHSILQISDSSPADACSTGSTGLGSILESLISLWFCIAIGIVRY